MADPPKITVTASISPRIKAQAKAHAKREDRSFSNVVERALVEYLAKYDAAEKPPGFV
jgi:hypothetical protein